MNIKNLFQKPKSKKISATTRRATMPVAEDYNADEPNVRLSSAFFVVMLLHVVAVAGIFAFSSLKKNATPPTENPILESATEPRTFSPDSRLYVVAANDSLGSIASAFGITRNDLETTNHLTSSSAIREGDKLVIPAKSAAQPVPLNVQKLLQLSESKPVPTTPVVNVKPATPTSSTPANAEATAPDGSGKTYLVQKGDNPVIIAKKHGIKYADLVAANKITDPKKLQIGQKLIIPGK